MMEVEMDRMAQSRMSKHQIDIYLHEHGLDLNKPYTVWERPDRMYALSYRGEARSNRVVGVIKTCIGLVPITEPWKVAG